MVGTTTTSNRRMDRFVRSGYLCVAGISDVGASGGQPRHWRGTVGAWGRWRSIDVSAGMLAVARIIRGVIHSASVTSDSQFGSIVLFVVIGARIVRNGPMRTLALVTLTTIVSALFGGELLDPIGVPGLWFPFGIGVSRTQYVYAIVIPLLAFLIVRDLPSP